MEELAEATGHERLAAELEGFTQMRHAIVHRGEAVRTRKKRAWECAKLVEDVVTVIDALVVARYIPPYRQPHRRRLVRRGARSWRSSAGPPEPCGRRPGIAVNWT
jgi:hypothetical protein